MNNPKQSYTTLPKRTKGPVENSFRKIVIDSNRYKVDVPKLSCLSVFAIRLMNEDGLTRAEYRQSIIQELLPQIKEFIKNPIVKDGLIFSLSPPLATDKTLTHKGYIVVIREVSRFDIEKKPQMFLYFLSNIMRKMMKKMEYIQISQSRKFITTGNKIDIENVVVYPGFRLNFELLDNGYFLTVDTTKKIVRNESVLEYINYLYKSHDNMQRDQKRQMVRKQLMNKIVMTNYGKTRYLRIDDLVFMDLTQVVVESCKMLLPQYYLSRYDYKIKNMKQPLIYSSCRATKFKTYLIPELCLMTGIPEDFDESKNKIISQASKMVAEMRKLQIDNFVEELNKKAADFIFPNLGIKIHQMSEKIEAKLIPLPKLVLGEGRTIQSGRQAGFNLQDMPIFKNAKPIKLGVIVMDFLDSSSILDYFYRTFKTIKLKIQVCSIKANDSQRSDSVYELIGAAKQKQKCNICLIIIPNKMKGQYQKIKEVALLEKQMTCQVVLEKTLKSKNIHSVALKILVQVLAKSGNTVWTSIPQAKKQKIMFVGYYSCQLAKSKSNSYTVGICATLDDLQTEIFSKISSFKKEHFEIQEMKELLLQALSAYKKRNGHIPEDIIVIQSIKSPRTQASTIGFLIQPAIKTMEEFYGLKRPKITYIFISKSLNHRFFRHFEGKCLNPPIGTVINSQVTQKGRYNFYLVGHNVCKNGGSIIPLSYRVIYSDSDIEEGLLQSFLLSQCFNYVNYTGAIRHPSILQYATKCAKFGADILGNMPVPEKLRTAPYFI